MEYVQMTLDDWVKMKQKTEAGAYRSEAELRENRLCAQTD